MARLRGDKAAPASPAPGQRAGDAGLAIPGLGNIPLPDFTNAPGMPGLKLRFEVNSRGHIVVSSQLLGLVPVKTTIDPDDALAGKYGRRIEADMRNPRSSRVSGDITFHGLPVSLPALDLGDTDFARAFSFMRAQVVDPNHVVIDGSYRSGQNGLPFHAEVKSTKIAPGVYDLKLGGLRLGSWNIPIPGFLASFCAWFMLKVLRGVDGVAMAGYGTLRIDMAAAAASTQKPA